MASLSLCAIVVMSLAICSAMPNPQDAGQQAEKPGQAPATYTNKYDNFDVDKVLNNGRILTSYIKCLMEEGPCTNEGRELIKYLPDALKTNCIKCTKVQKDTSEKVLKFMMSNRSADFERLSAKYDPTGEYKKNLLKLEKERDEQLKKQTQ
ncbi:ejaculatory bulb-specific protein 3-like [Daktulosphaira vitifoliae]|uniref:Chemosensory protein 2 n=1 Tax=Daktulosphaira vitifoliae TaxID=58002 RepID=A0A1W6R6F5_DAKVI|nr:ejaculatory bulb-specific protein 3-like [Daktulosphaira vitifoliae]ARO50008.1 chemosensory protein 2 [Daktulosphaira vitifoliae]